MLPESPYRVTVRAGRDALTPRIEHVDRSASAERVVELLGRDGCCVVDRLVEPGLLAELYAELEPWLARTPPGSDGFSGRRTRRTGGLVARFARRARARAAPARALDGDRPARG